MQACKYIYLSIMHNKYKAANIPASIIFGTVLIRCAMLYTKDKVLWLILVMYMRGGALPSHIGTMRVQKSVERGGGKSDSNRVPCGKLKNQKSGKNPPISLRFFPN